MVIFDSRTMLTGSGNQYVNPDYLRPLSPLPSELDAKSSPLALLAKTCSQIGAEPSVPNGKSGKSSLTLSSSGKRQETSSSSSSKDCKSVSPYNGFRSDSRGHGSGQSQHDRLGSRSRSGSVEIKVTDSTTTTSVNRDRDDVGKARSSLSSNVSSLSAKSPTTSLSIAVVEDEVGDHDEVDHRKQSRESPTRSSPSLTPTSSTSALSDTKSTPTKTVTSSSSSTDPSPIIRSGLEVLSGHHSNGSSSSRDLLFGGYRPPQLPPSLSYPGFPGGSSFPSHLSANPFWASFMSNSAASGVCRDPLCGDPFCPTALRNQQLFAAATGRLSASSALSNYSSLFSAAAAVQQREAAMMAAQRTAAAMAQAAAAASTPPGSAGGPKPYVCNWVAGADYCGRRFSSSEDLLIHLKTHTNLSTPSDPRTLASALLGVSTSGTASTASTLSTSSRFHPYARPLGSSVPPSLASALNPSLGLPPGYPHPYASLYPSLFPRPPLL